MKVINHKDRPLLEFPDEPWRPPLRMAVNRSAGANTVSVWLHDVEGQKRAPLHWHDVEEVLVFLDVKGEGFVRLGEEEYKVETQTSVVVPPGTVHCFGMRGQGTLKAMAVLPVADAVLGHRVLERGNESFELPPPKKQ
ncbi:MAG TPA: cupin domain-containing protein [Candidatus Binatia bacterium]|nr:cupin domain-containing protein [Candidatus Binatia bacterium]